MRIFSYLHRLLTPLQVQAPRRVWRRLLTLASLPIVLAFFLPSAHAFNSMSHAQILKTSWNWISSNAQEFPYASKWIASKDVQMLLIRANVDADFLPNLWLGSNLFSETFSASTFGVLNPFSTLLHHVNADTPGKLWEYDGYSFQSSSRRGRDLFAAAPTTYLDVERSSPFGGISSLNGMYASELGVYREGFRGVEQDWRRLYGGRRSLSEVTFPPAYVPAQLAWNRLLTSPRSEIPLFAVWHDSIPSIGLNGVSVLERRYWRSEIPGFPRDLELLGLALHLAQDMAVPQHARATADYCHVEFEELIDSLACEGTGFPNTDLKAQKEFVDGTYDLERKLPNCQSLVDRTQIREKYDQLPYLKTGHRLTAGELTLQAALDSSRWKFGKRWLGPYWSRLPSGALFEAKSCKELFERHEIRLAAKERYSLAVAISARLLENAAREYEIAHRKVGSIRTLISVPQTREP